MVDDLRVRAAGRSLRLPPPGPPPPPPGPLPPPAAAAEAYFAAGGRQPTPAYQLADLAPGHAVPGPAILIDAISTIVVEPGCTAHITGAHGCAWVQGCSAPSCCHA